MARIRTIKPAFWKSNKIAKLSIPARLLAIGLISRADDDGRFLASTASIWGDVFPNDQIAPAKIRRWMKELADCGLVHEYQYESVLYGVFPKWHDHQFINRYTPSTLPAPDIECVPRKAGVKS